MKTLSLLFPMLSCMFWLVACNQNRSSEVSTEKSVEEQTMSKGVGAFEDVQLTDPLVPDLISTGQNVYDSKCAGCHMLNSERKVGPGWAGVTNRRSPEWIMNMITNVDVMLEEDNDAQKLLQECLTRMPDQDISISDVDQVGNKDQGVQ